MPDGGLHHMTMIHTPMFFAAVPQTFLDKFIALAVDPAAGSQTRRNSGVQGLTPGQ